MARGAELAELTAPRREVMPVAPPEGPAEVWAMEGGAWRRVAGPLDPSDAAGELRRWPHVPACTVRGGTPCQVNGHVTGARLAALRPALAEARGAALGADPEVAPAQGAVASAWQADRPRCSEPGCRWFATSTGRCPSHERVHRRRLAAGAPSNDAAPPARRPGLAELRVEDPPEEPAPGACPECLLAGGHKLQCARGGGRGPALAAEKTGGAVVVTGPLATAAPTSATADEGTMKAKTKRKAAPVEGEGATTEAPAMCEARGCDAEVGKVRSDTNPALEGFCPAHRQTARERANHWGLSAEGAAQTLRDGVTERPADADAGAPARRKKARKPARRAAAAKRAPEADAPADVGAGLALVRRMAAVLERLGGVEGAEALADELDRMGGGR